MKKTLLILVIICLSTPSFSQSFSGPQKDIDSILKNITAFSKYYMEADYNGLANSYTKDGKILPPGPEIITGQEAIKQRWTLPEGVTILSHVVEPVEITIVKDTAYDIGYYHGTTRRKDGTEIAWKGKYMIIWKKIDGDWKIYADAWNKVN